MSQSTFDVVVVGAGPTGLLLALELSLAGVRPLVLERLTAPDLSTKAGSMGPLAAEALYRRGFADAIAAEEASSTGLMSALRPDTPADSPWRRVGGHFAGLSLIDQTRQREPERRPRGVRQSALEAMLTERVNTLGIALRRGEAVHDFTQHAQGVTVSVQRADGQVYTLETQYLVGCDGGRSPVRKRAGFAFIGTDPSFSGLQAVAELDHPERLLPAGRRRTDTGTISYGPTPGRIGLMRFDGPIIERGQPVTHAELEDTLRHVSGADVRVTHIHEATRWSDHARQAESYRLGRVLLAGDAAHVHSPFGGQGLALGLVDAVNLGWKLAATVRGGAPADLLDSYSAERHPVAARVLANTRAQSALMRPDVQTSALRDLVAEIMVSDWGTQYFGAMNSGVDTRYELGDAEPDVGKLTADRELAGEAGPLSISALMQEGGALLIDGSGQASQLAAPWRASVRCVRVQEPRSQLIRPDGCIAWARAGRDTAGLEAALTRWFGTPQNIDS